MTPDRGPDGRSLGYSHVEHVQPPNRGYAGYYLPNIYQENYRIRTAEELDALPDASVVLAVHRGGVATPHTRRRGMFRGLGGEYQLSRQLIQQTNEQDERLFLVYRPDMLPPRRDPA